MRRILRLRIARRLIRNYRNRKYRWLSNARVCSDGFDRTHGTDTTRIVQTRDAAGRDVHWYETASASTITAALDALGVDFTGHTFVDLGCGKGKPLLIAAGYPFGRVIGVDVDAACVAIARKNVAACGLSDRVELVVADATDYEPPAGPLLVYLFNPFPGWVLRGVIERLVRRLERSPDPLAVIYMNPCCVGLFERHESFRKVADMPGVGSRYERAVGFVGIPGSAANATAESRPHLGPD